MRFPSALILACVFTAAAAAAEPPTTRPSAEQIEKELRAMAPRDLLAETPPLPPDKDAFPLWAEAIAQLEREGEGLRERVLELCDAGVSLNGDNLLAAREIVERHRAALGLLDRGLARGRLRYPDPEGRGMNVPLPYLSGFRLLARLKSLEGRVFAADGNRAEAADSAADLYRMSVLSREATGFTINWLVGVSIQALADHEANALAETGALDDAGLKLHVELRTPERDDIAELDRAIRHEFTYAFLGTLAEVAADPQPLTRLAQETGDSGRIKRTALPVLELRALGVTLFDPHESVERSAALYQERREWLREGPTSQPTTDPDALSEDFQRSLDFGERLKASGEKLSEEQVRELRTKLHNCVGRLTVLALFPHFEAAGRTLRQSRASRHAVAAALAARRYELGHGRLPDSLDVLVEEGFLPAVPLDPFTEKPLRYDPARRLIWSVGKDIIDHGGAGDPAKPFQGEDDVWRVPQAGAR